jgi:maltooligosyltrehalose trehalohydrolase
VPRGTPAEGLHPAAFIHCIQNHDQVGNRAMGERTTHLLSLHQLMQGAALLFFSPFVPMLFQGEEWGSTRPFYYFIDTADPELASAVLQGRRKEVEGLGWDPSRLPDPSSEAAFLDSKLDWAEASQSPHEELLGWHRALIGLRKGRAELRDGRVEAVDVRFDEAARFISIRRGALKLTCNFSRRPLFLKPGLRGKRLILSSEGGPVGGAKSRELGGHAVAIWEEEA